MLQIELMKSELIFGLLPAHRWDHDLKISLIMTLWIKLMVRLLFKDIITSYINENIKKTLTIAINFEGVSQQTYQ